MEPEPQPNDIINNVPDDSSKMFGISLRGIIAIVLTTTVCSMSMMNIQVVEPLYTLATVAISFYFGHSIGSSKK